MPGLTNRLLASLVSAAAVTYEESARVLSAARRSSRAIRFGRSSFVQEAYEQHSSPPGAARVLVFGGSQGAHAINVAMVEAAPRLAAAASATGDHAPDGERDLEMVRDGVPARRARSPGRAVPVRDGSGDEGGRPGGLSRGRDDAGGADGGGTAVDSDSVADAPPTITSGRTPRRLRAAGAAPMVEQRELTGERLAREILALARDDAAARRRMGEAAARLARPDAARRHRGRVVELAKRDRRRQDAGTAMRH